MKKFVEIQLKNDMFTWMQKNLPYKIVLVNSFWGLDI